MLHKIKFGEIRFKDDRLTITDKNIGAGRIELLTIGSLLILSTVSLLIWVDKGMPKDFTEYIYIPILIITILLLLRRLRFTSKSTILYLEIEDVKYGSRFGSEWNDIIIGNKKRRIISTQKILDRNLLISLSKRIYKINIHCYFIILNQNSIHN